MRAAMPRTRQEREIMMGVMTSCTHRIGEMTESDWTWMVERFE